MFYLIGLGLFDIDDMSIKALNALRNCLIGKNKNAGAVSNNKDLLYLFRNDLRRAQMLRFLLGKIK